ncbi:DUF5719 family protein [Streptomyces bambusae]|uniref:DUF5719 family protein n=1 Tax=Streptomyces bambusae TaxID=1550616 RepID=UPI001CFD17A8|nr:DUF5719 family protein [Streptomyces bambusae]MCB5166332.1 DUF5719 family protein [Streptomyces bambusae]
MNRAPLTLAAVAAALAAVTGIAAFTAPDGRAGGGAQAAARLPVERSTLVCPVPSGSDVAETTYTAFTPATPGAAAGKGTATLVTAVKQPKALLTLKEPGKPVGATAAGAEAPALAGSADGVLAPGWTAQQTTTVPVGSARGVLGTGCSAPDTDFWFPGTATSKNRQDYLHLTNPDDDTAAVVDIQLYGPDGTVKSDSTGTEGFKVPPRTSLSVSLATLSPTPLPDVTAHVTTRSGRVGATVQVQEDGVGSDWLPAAADAAPELVLPGLPADATDIKLVVHAPGDDDADLKVRLAGPTGSITPAGSESVHVKSGMTTAVYLKDVTRGEAGSLLLTPADPKHRTPVVASVRVIRGTGEKQELALIPATAPVGTRATAADNRAAGTTLSLTAPGTDATVRVTASAGTGGGTPATKTYTVKKGTTLAVKPPVPAGLKGSYALTVETVSGGPVHAARTLELPHEGVLMFTVQTLQDDRGTVPVPDAVQDLSVLSRD